MPSTLYRASNENFPTPTFSKVIPKGFQRAAQGCPAEVASRKAGLPWGAMRPTQPSSTLKGLLLFAPRAILLALLLVYLGCTPAPPAVNKTTPPITPEITLVDHPDP